MPLSPKKPFIYSYIIFLILIVTAVLVPVRKIIASNEIIPRSSSKHLRESFFNYGNYYTYSLYWSFINVGTAKLKFSILEEFDSEARLPEDSYYKIEFSVISNHIINSVYPVHSKIVSILDKNHRPVYYRKNLNQGNEIEDTELIFDWGKQKIFITENGKNKNPINLISDCLDPLSMIVSLCLNDFETKSDFSKSVSDGNKIVEIKSSLENKVDLQTKLGLFNSKKVSIETNELRGVFKKSPDANVHIYLNEDLPSIPIKLSSKVAIGNFYALIKEGTHNGKKISGMRIDTDKDLFLNKNRFSIKTK